MRSLLGRVPSQIFENNNFCFVVAVTWHFLFLLSRATNEINYNLRMFSLFMEFLRSLQSLRRMFKILIIIRHNSPVRDDYLKNKYPAAAAQKIFRALDSQSEHSNLNLDASEIK